MLHNHNERKPLYPGTLDEYSEMVIQYGYITLFAAAFPLSPLFAFLNNAIEIRTDALKLITAHSRPEYRGAQNIGYWYDMLYLLGTLSVITNCCIIGFSLNSIPDIFGTKDPTTGHYEYYVMFNAFAVIVIMEHFLFAFKSLLSFLIPDVPGDIKKNRARQDFIKEQTLKARIASEVKVWKTQELDSEAGTGFSEDEEEGGKSKEDKKEKKNKKEKKGKDKKKDKEEDGLPLDK